MENKPKYNTQRKRLPMPEYGRSIQNLVDYTLTVEDRAKRQRCAEAIIQLMGNMFPQWRDVPDYNHKLWDHLALMSGYQLDIDYPVEIVRAETAQEKPHHLSYQKHAIRFRHYGNTLEKFIKCLADYPEGKEKEQLVSLVANHMKRSMIQWNPTIASDKKVVNDLAEMTHGAVQVSEQELATMTVALKQAQKQPQKPQKASKSKSKAKRKK